MPVSRGVLGTFQEEKETSVAGTRTKGKAAAGEDREDGDPAGAGRLLQGKHRRVLSRGDLYDCLLH